MLFDADVLIWIERGNLRAARAVDSAADPGLSVVTYMELVEGARDKAGLRAIRETMTQFGLAVLPLSDSIGQRATMYLETYRLRSGLDLVDALVAATAVESAQTVCTGNVKHFRVIPDLSVKPFRP